MTEGEIKENGRQENKRLDKERREEVDCTPFL